MKNYFSFTRSQQIGVMIWAVIIVGLIVTPKLFKDSRFDEKFQVNKNDVEYVQLNAESHFNYSHNSDKQTSDKRNYSLFDFDPNLLDLSGWESLGFSKKQADAIVNYRTKYGPFKRKDELKKIFVISEEKYLELEPYIKIEASGEVHVASQLISLNEASSLDLEMLPGIGPKFAERIIKFRNSLGGFTSMTQLHEVYNMTEEVYQILVDHTQIVPGKVTQIKINSASKDEIDKHPYIDFDVTAAIIKERELRKIENLDFLITKNLITKEEKEKIEPYISFE